MATKIILPHGGYRNLLTYKKSDVIYQGTAVFVKRFLQRGDRMEGVPDLPVAPQDEAGLTKTFQTWPRGWFHIP